MNLLIISAMPHHVRDGEIVGWGPTVRELDQLATRFTRVRHIACLHDGPARASDLAYTATNIELVPVAPAGGNGIRGKLDALRASPRYVRTILQELEHADFVHVRAPANIALIGMLLVSARERPIGRWFKYAGNWRPTQPESAAYSLQRWWLGHAWHRGVVTVNGTWPGQPPWVRTFYNPSLDANEIERGRQSAQIKQILGAVRMLYVGRVETPKGAGRAIEIVRRLVGRGIDATLDVVGDGAEREAFERDVITGGLGQRIRFLGWRSHHEMHAFYERAHISLLPTSASEGWPKVLSEGMAFGLVPLAGAVSSIPQYLSDLEIGAAIAPDDLNAYVDAVARYVLTPELWAAESKRAVAAAQRFTFEHYLASIDNLIAQVTERS